MPKIIEANSFVLSMAAAVALFCVGQAFLLKPEGGNVCVECGGLGEVHSRIRPVFWYKCDFCEGSGRVPPPGR